MYAGDEVYDDDVTSGIDLSYRNPHRIRLARRLYGWAPRDAVEARKCIRCRCSVNLLVLSRPDLDEYWISGLCPSCFALITEPAE